MKDKIFHGQKIEGFPEKVRSIFKLTYVFRTFCGKCGGKTSLLLPNYWKEGEGKKGDWHLLFPFLAVYTEWLKIKLPQNMKKIHCFSFKNIIPLFAQVVLIKTLKPAFIKPCVLVLRCSDF